MLKNIHLPYLLAKEIAYLSLDKAALKNRVGNEYFRLVVSYLCESYRYGADFEEYVSYSDLPLGTDYFH